ncbi:MAG: RNA polymerase sigma-70 factor (ECF subfamily), partial [Planctomycetota bacterium]
MSSSNMNLDDLFESENERLYSLAFRITGRHHEAEDAVQETWLSAIRGEDAFRGEAQAKTWLYRIALRASIAVRSRRKKGSGPLDHDPKAPSKSDAAEMKELTDRLLLALDTLSTEHRTALALTAIDGLSTKRISEI